MDFAASSSQPVFAPNPISDTADEFDGDLSMHIPSAHHQQPHFHPSASDALSISDDINATFYAGLPLSPLHTSPQVSPHNSPIQKTRVINHSQTSPAPKSAASLFLSSSPHTSPAPTSPPFEGRVQDFRHLRSLPMLSLGTETDAFDVLG